MCDAYKIAVVGGPTSQSQGMVELMNREIQRKLLRLGIDSEDYSREGFQALLTRMMLKHNVQPRPELRGLTPNEVVLGWRSTENEMEDYVVGLKDVKKLMELRLLLHRQLLEARKKTAIPDWDSDMVI